METKTIILSEKEGKRYEIHLYCNEALFSSVVFNIGQVGIIFIFSGSVSDFLNIPNKEEIAEKVVNFDSDGFYNYLNHESENIHPFSSAIDSIMSAIGDYKYIIITETEI